MREVCLGKMSADGKPAHDRTRILTHSARKKNRKGVLANYIKTRINIGHRHDRWMELKETLRVQTHAEVQTSVSLRMYKCISEIGTCIINDAGRQAAQKTTKIHVFCHISPNDVLYTCFEHFTFKAKNKKKLSKKLPNCLFLLIFQKKNYTVKTV